MDPNAEEEKVAAGLNNQVKEIIDSFKNKRSVSATVFERLAELGGQFENLASKGTPPKPSMTANLIQGVFDAINFIPKYGDLRAYRDINIQEARGPSFKHSQSQQD